VSRFGGGAEPSSAETASVALNGKAWTLAMDGRNDDAVRAFDQIVERYGDRPEAAIATQVCSALLHRGIVLGQRVTISSRAETPPRRVEDAVRSYDEVVRRFGDYPDVLIGEMVAQAMVEKCMLRMAGGSFEQAFRLVDEIVERYGAATSPRLVAGAAHVVLSKAFSLLTHERHAEAFAVLDGLIDRFGLVPDPAVVQLVERARRLREDAGRRSPSSLRTTPSTRPGPGRASDR
jgi:hypothetical protein